MLITFSSRYISTLTIKRCSNRYICLPCTLNHKYHHDAIIHHHDSPNTVGSMNRKDTNVGTGIVGAQNNNQIMKLQIRVNTHGIIKETQWNTFGWDDKTSSFVSKDWLKNKTIQEVMDRMNNREMQWKMTTNITPMLVDHAIRAAVGNYQQKQWLVGRRRVY